MNLKKTQRTVWQVNNRIEFFDQTLCLLNIDDTVVEGIKEQLSESDFDYLEIACYLPGNQSDDPDAPLVFDGKKDVYWDIFNVENSSERIQKIRTLTKKQLSRKCSLTLRDWRKRLEAVSGL